MAYVDGVIIAVPDANREAFIAYAAKLAAMFTEYGATEVVDCWGSDVPDGKQTSLPLAVKLKANETVAFSWIKWPDKATRDAGWAKAEADPLMRDLPTNLFDGGRMIFGGFDVVQSMGARD